MNKDELYQTILEGLGQYLRNPLIGDILHALNDNASPALAHSLNKNQMASKAWLLDELHRAAGGNLGLVYLLGGWHGVLAALLLADARFKVAGVLSFDMDPACEPMATALNHRHAAIGRFKAVTADARRIQYGAIARSWPAGAVADGPQVVINTSCEHLECFDEWYTRLPDDVLLILQSNNYFDCDEHVNCVPSLDAFREQAPLRELLYAGSLALKRYTRFMLIGRKGHPAQS